MNSLKKQSRMIRVHRKGHMRLRDNAAITRGVSRSAGEMGHSTQSLGPYQLPLCTEVQISAPQAGSNSKYQIPTSQRRASGERAP